MNKIIYLFIILAIVLIVFNASFLDFDNLFKGDSKVAMIGILAGACVIVLMLILKIARTIAQKKK